MKSKSRIRVKTYVLKILSMLFFYFFYVKNKLVKFSNLNTRRLNTNYESFSTNFEDLFIIRFVNENNEKFKNKKYIDIGCNHPIFTSNTFGLYKLGWKGLVIDAEISFKKKFKKYRPKDKFVSALVSNNNDNNVTFYSSKNDVLKQSSSINLNDNLNDAHYLIKNLKSENINSILQFNHFEKEVDFLNIDVESETINILKEINLSVITPKIICIEDHDDDFTRSQIYQLLSNEYYIYAYLKPSVIYVRKNL